MFSGMIKRAFEYYGCRFYLRHADIISIINIHCCFVLPMSMSEFWWRNGDNGFISVSVNEFIKDDENFAKMHPATLAHSIAHLTCFEFRALFPFKTF